MSKKDFIALADALRADYQAGRLSDEVIGTIMLFCKGQNDRFMPDRWLSYLKGKCGKNGGAIKK